MGIATPKRMELVNRCSTTIWGSDFTLPSLFWVIAIMYSHELRHDHSMGTYSPVTVEYSVVPMISHGKTSTSTSPQKTRAKQEEDLTDRVGMSRANTRKTKQQDLANENSNWLVFEIDNRPGYLSRKTTNKPLSRKSSMTVIGSCNYRMISLSPKPITHWLEGGQTDFWDFFVQKLCGSSGNYWGISLNLHQLRLCS